jgi:hypothetical protein
MRVSHLIVSSVVLRPVRLLFDVLTTIAIRPGGKDGERLTQWYPSRQT